MPNIYIDPYLFALPDKNSGKESFELYIENLLEWKELDRRDLINLFTLNETHEILLATNRYPLWDELRIIIKTFGINYIQPKDIVDIVDSFLNKLKGIQNYLGLEDYLHENAETTPVISGRDLVFVEKMVDLLNLTFLKSIIHREDIGHQFILTSNFNSDNINIKSSILIAEFSSAISIPLPLAIDATFNMCRDFLSVCKTLDLFPIFQQNNDRLGFKNIIFTNTFLISKELGYPLTIEQLDTFSFGSVFLDNIKNLHIDNNRKIFDSLLRAISETILDVNLADTHHIRTGSSGNNPQLFSGKFGAWRRDITNEFHLHYWKQGNVTILANVVPHNDFKITHPD